jgi:large repetitive protein
VNTSSMALGLSNGTTGLTRVGTSLVVDLNQDGIANAAEDLVIQDFFAPGGTGAGTGLIEYINGLTSEQILNYFAGINNAPAAGTVFKTGTEDTVLTFSAADFGNAFTDVDGDTLAQIQITSLPSNGTLYLNGVAVVAAQTINRADIGGLTFTPAANFNGYVDFGWNGFDGATYAANSGTVSTYFVPVNDAPVVSIVSKTGNTITFSPADFTSAFEDIDVNGLTQIQITSLPSDGTLRLNGNVVTIGQTIATSALGNLTFTPTAGFNGNVSFGWNGFDGTTYAATAATVNMTINGTTINTPPTVSAIALTGNEDSTITFTAANFTSAFSDADGNTLTQIQITSLPGNGTLSLNGTAVSVGAIISAANLSSLTFTPAANFNGNVSFGWNGFDGTTYAVTGANVNLTINAINDAPIVNDIALTTAEDTVLTVISLSTTTFTNAFSDVDGNTLSQIQITSLPTNGTLSLNGNPVSAGEVISASNLTSLTFTPDANFNGAISFGWNGYDGTTYAVTGANINITVTAVNDVPVVSDVSITGNEDTVITFSAANFSSGFSDVDSSLTQIQITSLPANGTLSFNRAAVTSGQTINVTELSGLTFTPNSNFNGNVSFGWNGSDGTTYAVTGANVNLTITAVNDAPVVSTVSKTGNTITFSAADFTSAFADIDGNALTQIQITSLPSNGTLSLNGDAVTAGQIIATAALSNLTFTPTAGFNGDVSFGWNGYDGTTYAATAATVNMAINGNTVNTPPTVSAIALTGNEDSTITFSAANFTSAFSDADGNALTQIQITSLPTNGILTLNGVEVTAGLVIPADSLGNLAFTPSTNFNGNVSFGWNGYDGSTYAVTEANVNLTINSVNDAPVAQNDAITATFNTPLVITPDILLDNDIDIDGDSLSISALGGATNGTVALDANGNVVFTPTTGFSGTTSFQYTVSDSFGDTSTATVNVTVNGGSTGVNLSGGSKADKLTGTDYNDTLSGNLGNDTLQGLAGDDLLQGGRANDKLYGDDGADSLYGDNGNDFLDGGTGNDLLNGGDSADSLYGQAGNDTLQGGNGNDSLYGQADNDILQGGNGNDSLYGGDGSDILTGGFDRDALTGGAGEDFFRFETYKGTKGGLAADTILDFTVGEDKIQISASGFGGGLIAGVDLGADQFVIGSAAQDRNDRFIYDSTTGALFYDTDGTGSRAQIQIGILSTGLALTQNSFQII